MAFKDKQSWRCSPKGLLAIEWASSRNVKELSLYCLLLVYSKLQWNITKNNKKYKSLSCSTDPSQISRHVTVNPVKSRSLTQLGMHQGTTCTFMNRWENTRCADVDATVRGAVWNATITDMVAPSYLHTMAVAAGTAADFAVMRKNGHLFANHNFVTMAFEILGPIYIRVD